MTNNLSGRALAEAAAKVMGKHADNVFSDWASGEMLPGLPDECADFDYLCLEWAREHWQPEHLKDGVQQSECRWCSFRNVLPHSSLYKPGDYARALVAAAGEGER